MSSLKKRFNWKAREAVNVSVDNSHQNKIEIDIQQDKSCDEANQFLLPSTKRKTEVEKKDVAKVRLLSKKQRKYYEKIEDKKKKKQERAKLDKALAKVQVDPEILSKLISVPEMQTKGRKRFHENIGIINSGIEPPSNSKRLKPRVPLKIRRMMTIDRPKSTADVVGFDSSDSNEDTESESELETKDIKVEETTMLPKVSSVVEEQEIIVDKTEAIEKLVPIVGNPEEIYLSDESEDATEIDTKSKNMSNSGVDNKVQSAPNKSSKADSEHQNVAVEKVKKFIDKSGSSPSKEKTEVSKTFVPVQRSPEIQRNRLKLPIIGEEQTIMEAINEHDVVIIAGETGSGKTTQVPQFLFEAGYCSNGKMIGITEPRRVAAVSMSHRVGEELNLSSEEVSYLIRFEGNAGPKTQIKFMTDGVLLREIQKDFFLTKYSAIILDEAHERGIFTDILIGLLSIITSNRRKRKIPLKTIIMSATLRLSDFTDNTKLFKTPPPVIKVDSRQFPVTIHFNKRTADDYMKEAFNKACKIHTMLPEGGILIFVTGQHEVNRLVKKLRQTFPLKENKNCFKENSSSEANIEDDLNSHKKDSDDDDYLVSHKKFKQKLKKVNSKSLPRINLEDYDVKPTEDEIELFESDDEFEDECVDELEVMGKKCQPMWVLPLYSMLPSKKQKKVFEPPPEGCRFCVVATNVAETSLTIPHIKYVIDSGRTKAKLYDKFTGISAYTITWTSKASADQRAGRSGRTSAGHCYRLYSSAVFNDEFEAWSVPEIQRKPIDDLLLQMKSMKIIRVVDFPFPSPPDCEQLRSAERRLILLGALERPITMKDEWSTKITSLGESMAAFPVAPRFAKMLCLSNQFNLLQYTVAIVAALSVQEFLLMPNDSFNKIWRTWAGSGHSLLLGDVMVLLRALGAAEYASTTKDGVEKFCAKTGLRHKAVIEARKLRVQLTNELNLSIPSLNLSVDPKMPPPTDSQARQLRQIMLCGLVDQVAYKMRPEELKEAGLSVGKLAYRISTLNEVIYLNAASVLRKQKPEWIVYQEVYQQHEKLYARGITAVDVEWLPVFASTLCNISEPLKDPPPYYDDVHDRIMCYVSSTFGRSGWLLPVTSIVYPPGEDRYKWFGKFFLEGTVCTKLKKYTSDLISSPELLFKNWTKFWMGRVNNFLNALIDQRIDSKCKLLEKWRNDPNYLLNNYVEWLPQSAFFEIKSIWPPLDDEEEEEEKD